MAYAVHNSARRIKRKVESFERARADRLPPDAVLASPFGQQPFTTETRTRENRTLFNCTQEEIVEASSQAYRACLLLGKDEPTAARVSWRVLAPFLEVYTEEALVAIHALAVRSEANYTPLVRAEDEQA